jgi:two-component system LytT family response regulator
MMTTAIIVDDEVAGRRSIRDCCERLGTVQIVGEFADSESTLAAIRASPPDIVFLDIKIDEMTGLDIARALDPQCAPSIVFVTAYDQYAIQAFDLSAADYLLKPFDEARFRRSFARALDRRALLDSNRRLTSIAELLTRLSQRPRLDTAGARLLAEGLNGRMRVVEAAEIEVAEADRNYVRLSVGSELLSIRATLQQLEASLKDEPMLRISRSCIVNTKHVREISRTPRGDLILVTKSGRTVTCSAGYREVVRRYWEHLRLPQPPQGEAP